MPTTDLPAFYETIKALELAGDHETLRRMAERINLSVAATKKRHDDEIARKRQLLKLSSMQRIENAKRG